MAKRETAAIIMRGYLDALGKRGLMTKVRERASPALQQLIDKPPMPIGWVPTELNDELMAVLAPLISREDMRAIALEMLRDSVGPVLRPVLAGVLRLFGGSPASIYGHMDRVSAVMLRGITFAWEPDGPKSGFISVLNLVPQNELGYAAWEGAFEFAFEVCKVKGEVGQTELLDGGLRGRVRVRWS